jgi:deazaflavin-dependent oxidoreductase (nitroreductase family)
MTDGIDFQQFNQQVVSAFRSSGGVGELGPVHFDSLVLLTTTGRRSGQPRTVPLGSAADDDGNRLLFASNMGSPKHPDWYLNIAADPHVTIELTGVTYEAEAVVLAGGERDDAYRRWIELAPHVADHEKKAGREIPMIRIPGRP